MRHLTRRAVAALTACLVVAVPAGAAFADDAAGTAPTSSAPTTSPPTTAAPATAAPATSDPAATPAPGTHAPAATSASGDTSADDSAPATSVTLDNSAVSVDTKDNTSVFRLKFTVVHSSGPAVTVSNVALAVTDCSNCRAVAIAIQVDLVWPVPASLTAGNVAVAVTSGCTTCDALAAAFQYVIATNQRVVLTRLGHREVRQIERQLRELRASTLSSSDLAARVNTLAAQLGSVLATQLVPAGRGADSDVDGGGHGAPAPASDHGHHDD